MAMNINDRSKAPGAPAKPSPDSAPINSRPKRYSAELATLQEHIDLGLRMLEATDAQLASSSSSRMKGWPNASVSIIGTKLETEWEALKRNLATLGPAELTAQHLHLVADVRP